MCKVDINILFTELQKCVKRGLLSHFNLIPKVIDNEFISSVERTYISVVFEDKITDIQKYKLEKYLKSKYKIYSIEFSINRYVMRIYLYD